MSLNFVNMTRSQDTSTFLTKTNAKMQSDLNMNDYKIINLAKPENKQDAANKAYVDKLIDHIGVHIIDPMYETAIYGTEMATTGPYGTKSEIIPTHPDVVMRYEEITLSLKWDKVSTLMATDGQQMFVFAGFNKISGTCTKARIKLEYPQTGIDYIGVFATDRDVDFGKHIVSPRAETLFAGTYKLNPNGNEFQNIKYIGVELVGVYSHLKQVWVKFELVLDMRVSAE